MHEAKALKEASMDLWQMVTNDHANIEELCREVLRATGSGPNSRAELFDDLQDELERPHAGLLRLAGDVRSLARR